MSKTSRREATAQIDPMIRAEAEQNMALARSVAAMGYNPYEGNTTADFSTGQRAAFNMADAASGAFGMQGGVGGGGPTGATTGAYGIAGFSPETTRATESPISPELQAMLDDFYQQAGTNTAYQAPLTPGGGKK